MKDQDKTKRQLINELAELRQRIAELEAAEAERVWAEEALAYERELLQTLMDNSPDYIFFKDRESGFIRTNWAHLQILDIAAPQEAVGKTDFDFFPQEDAQRFYDEEQSIMESGQPVIAREWWVPGKAGERIWLSEHKIPVTDETGQVVGLMGLSRDITERVRAQEALRESEKRFKDIAQSSADWVWEVNNEGRYTFASGKVNQILGYEPEELIGKTPFELMHEDEAKRVGEVFEKIVSRKKPIVDLENWNLTKDGERVCLLTNGVPILDEEGDLQGYRGVDKDITERVRAEEELAYVATHDPLTGLPNRRLFNDRLNLELVYACRNHQKLTVMLLDLDHFKDVNDTLGHSVGDQLQRLVGGRLTSLLRKSDTVARMGGDEFMLIVPGIAQAEDAAQVAQKILNAFRRPFVFDDHELRITTSIGIAIYPSDGEDVDTLMKNADIAMYRAKDQGRDNVQCYTPAMRAEA